MKWLYLIAAVILTLVFDLPFREYETAQLEKLKAEGREKSATYRQYLGNRLMYKAILEKYRQYGLID